MPKRTNEFQQLVALIQRALAPQGARVTESYMAPVPGFAQSREIDILVESSIGIYRMKVAVEATKSKRPLNSETFGKIASKYFIEGGVKVDRLAIVTQAGFTPDVKTRAARLRVDLFTLREAEKADWAKMVPSVAFNVAPHVCRVELIPAWEEEKQAGFVKTARLVCSCCGKDSGPLLKLAWHVYTLHALKLDPNIPQKLFEFARRDPGQQAFATFEWPIAGVDVVFEDKKHRPEALRITVHAVHARGIAKCTKYQMTSEGGDELTFHHAHAIVGPKKLSVIFPNAPADKLVLKVENAPNDEA